MKVPRFVNFFPHFIFALYYVIKFFKLNKLSFQTTSQLASSNSSSSCGSNLVNHNSSMSSGVSSLTDSPSNRSTGGISSTGTASCSSSPYYYCNGDSGYDNYGHVGNGTMKKFNVKEMMAKGVAVIFLNFSLKNQKTLGNGNSCRMAQQTRLFPILILISITRLRPSVDLTNNPRRPNRYWNFPTRTPETPHERHPRVEYHRPFPLIHPS